VAVEVVVVTLAGVLIAEVSAEEVVVDIITQVRMEIKTRPTHKIH
jgi:hypothetical protein